MASAQGDRSSYNKPLPNLALPGASPPDMDTAPFSRYSHNSSIIPDINHPDSEAAHQDPPPLGEAIPGADLVDPTHPNSLESILSQVLPPVVGKPQVIVRIRPIPHIDTTPPFEVDQQTKTIQIRVDRGRKAQEPSSHKPPPGFIYFPADSVLENSSQEDTFSVVAQEVVEKAMQGIPGMVVAIGPESSGKSYSLFALSGRYRNRGIAARALEKMFEIRDRRQGETDFKFGMGIIEVRRDRIRDLLTLSPQEINDVGKRGPKEMYIEEVDCMEHGLGLLLRALIGQKLIHQEPYERFHTLVYFEILAVTPMAPELVQFESRITFAEIASAPYQDNVPKQPPSMESLFYRPNPAFCEGSSYVKPEFKQKQAVFPIRKCSNPGYTTGPLAESIAVRRDTFALEQIFLKANEQFKIRKYFAKLENLGLSMIASEKRRLSSGHNFRQNRLAHCLKDILDKHTEIRIVLHVRPDKAYLKSSLEAMRFAERARLVPSNLGNDEGKGKRSRTEDQILQEVIGDIAPELMHPANVEELNNEKMRVIQEQAVKYFEEKIEEMKVVSKEKVKGMFENFRVLLNFLWELELNVTLRKAEEGMKKEMEKMGQTVAALQVPEGGRKGSDTGKTELGDFEEDAVTKKSTRKMKKDKKKRRKEEKAPKEKRTSSNDIKAPKWEEDGGKRQSGDKLGEEEAQSGSRKGSLVQGEEAGGDGGVKGEAEVNYTSPPETGEGVGGALEVQQEIVQRASRVSMGRGEKRGTEEEAIQQVQQELEKKEETGSRKGDEEEKKISVNSQGMTKELKALEQQPGPVGGEPPMQNQIVSSTTHIHQVSGLRHNSTIFVKGAFADFKLHNVWGGGGQEEGQTLTEEERQQLAAQQEEQISNNFEEMKKIARRQAIHLLRTGVRRPQWLTFF